jgi:hypothetical protein
MKIRFSFLIGLSAALIAGCAAYYSVFGLSQLFAGASLAVIIMASSLEVSKIISVSLLQRYWSKLSTPLKFYLCTGVFILVCITSGGIYGFLSNAYQKTANKFELNETQISSINEKKEVFKKSITDNQSIINTKTQRIQQLTNLRGQQENRFDNSNNTNKNRIRNDISLSNNEIQKLNVEIDTLNRRNSSLSDSVTTYTNKVIDLKSNDTVSAEIGPLKYLSQLTGQPMDRVVNWFILLLIFVFDPLAIALVIAANKVSQLENENDRKNQNISDDTIPDEPETEKDEKIEVIEVVDETEKPIVEQIEEKPNNTEEIKVKKEPIVPNGKIELKDIKEIKESNRLPLNETPEETITQRSGANKFLKDDGRTLYFKRNKK